MLSVISEQRAVGQRRDGLGPAVDRRPFQPGRRLEIGARAVEALEGAEAVPPFKGDEPGSIRQACQTFRVTAIAARQRLPRTVPQPPGAQVGEAGGLPSRITSRAVIHRARSLTAVSRSSSSRWRAEKPPKPMAASSNSSPPSSSRRWSGGRGGIATGLAGTDQARGPSLTASASRASCPPAPQDTTARAAAVPARKEDGGARVFCPVSRRRRARGCEHGAVRPRLRRAGGAPSFGPDSCRMIIVFGTLPQGRGQAASQRPRPSSPRRHATSGARSAAARCQASAASSSKSSASFFIMVPPNSSASTMVTARR